MVRPPPRPVNNILFDACQDNINRKIYHRQNNTNTNKNRVALEIDDNLFPRHAPTVDNAKKHKDKFIKSNPQLNVPLLMVTVALFLEFQRWLWKVIIADMHVCTKYQITQYINISLKLMGGEKIANCMQLVKWILSPQAITNVPTLWMALNGYWDDNNNIFLIVQCIKCRCGIDFLKFKEGYCLTRMAKYCIGQIRKPIANKMDDEYGLSLQKSSNEHEQEKKSWNKKRKKGEYHEKFKFWRSGNASKNKCNDYCRKHGLIDHMVDIDEVDTTLKEEPSADIL